MSTLSLPRVSALSLRVALITAGIVAITYSLIAVLVVVIVDHNLTAQIDTRLHAAIARAGNGPVDLDLTVPGGPRYGPPLLIWIQRTDGDVLTNATVSLPMTPADTSQPRTVPICSASTCTDVRILGTSLGDAGYLVVGQTMDDVSRARTTVITAELIVGPVLMLTVFAGAFLIGRRVGAPIEAARQRQMQFTADASHELRTPLSVIEAQTSLAQSQERDTDWYRAAFARVGAESQRMRQLVEDLLWLARLDAQQTDQPQAQPTDLGAVAEQAVQRFLAVAQTRGLTLQLQVAPGDHIVVAPPVWLDRVCGVLVDNACRYTPEGGWILVQVSGDGRRVRLAVDDSGPGIPVAQRSHIFDRFHRASDTPGGSGLGLAIADAVVRSSGGRWEIGESSARGASMAIVWPRGSATA